MAVVAESQLTLSTEECEFLANFLESSLKEKRVEERRTRTPGFREQVIHEEDLIVSLLKKLGRSP